MKKHFKAIVIGLVLVVGIAFAGDLDGPAENNVDWANVAITGGTITGITDLTVADGGTGASTLTANGVLVGAGTSAVSGTTAGTTGQVLLGVTSSNPAMTTIKGVKFIPVYDGINGTTAPDAAEILTATKSIEVRQFSGTANQDVRYIWRAPFDLTSATISVAVTGIVSHATAPANGEIVAYSISAASRGNSDPLSTATSGTQTSALTADATYVQYDFLQTAFSAAMTVTNLAAGESINIDVARLATTTDTYGQKIGQEGILIKYSLALSGT